MQACVSSESFRAEIIPPSSAVQYLFNVPEGFARLVLEHRMRPGMGLRAVMTTGSHPGAVVGD